MLGNRKKNKNGTINISLHPNAILSVLVPDRTATSKVQPNRIFVTVILRAYALQYMYCVFYMYGLAINQFFVKKLSDTGSEYFLTIFFVLINKLNLVQLNLLIQL